MSPDSRTKLNNLTPYDEMLQSTIKNVQEPIKHNLFVRYFHTIY